MKLKLGDKDICEPYIRELLDKTTAIRELYTYVGTDILNKSSGLFFPYNGHKSRVEILTNRLHSLYGNHVKTLDKMISDIKSMEFSPIHYKTEIEIFVELIRERWKYVIKHLTDTLDEISIYTEEDREEKLAIIESEYGVEIANRIRYRITIENLEAEFSRSQTIFYELDEIKNYTSTKILSEDSKSDSNVTNENHLTIGVLTIEQSRGLHECCNDRAIKLCSFYDFQANFGNPENKTLYHENKNLCYILLTFWYNIFGEEFVNNNNPFVSSIGIKASDIRRKIKERNITKPQKEFYDDLRNAL